MNASTDKFRHSAEERKLFRYPAMPTVIEQKDKKGKRLAWSVNMQILITTSGNRLENHRWVHATSAYPTQSLDAHYRREEVIMYFLRHHEPSGEDIIEEEYLRLKDQYGRTQ